MCTYTCVYLQHAVCISAIVLAVDGMDFLINDLHLISVNPQYVMHIVEANYKEWFEENLSFTYESVNTKQRIMYMYNFISVCL